MLTKDLILFVQKSARQGATEIEIRQKLISHGGWGNSDINEAFEMLGYRAIEPARKFSKKKLALVSVFVVMLSVALYAAFFIFNSEKLNAISQKPNDLKIDNNYTATQFPEMDIVKNDIDNVYNEVEDTIKIEKAETELVESSPKEVEVDIQIKEAEVDLSPKIYSEDTQFVMISFDGSRSLSSWEKTLDFAKELKDKGVSLKFTYFISGVYFLPYGQENLYKLSWLTPGSSAILFGDTPATIDKRISYLNQALAEGHEIGSHLNGHFNAINWTQKQWSEEFDAFRNIMFDTLTEKLNRTVQPNFTIDGIKGIRSPELSKNKALYQTLAKNNFTYDASRVTKIGTPPWQDKNNIWQFPLVFLEVGGKKTLSMDYNHYVVQTNATDKLRQGTKEWEKAKQDVLNAYLYYFDQEYRGVRAPVNIGHHFSMWNDGVYWEALKEFAGTVCGKKDVVCTNYSDLVEFLESK